MLGVKIGQSVHRFLFRMNKIDNCCSEIHPSPYCRNYFIFFAHEVRRGILGNRLNRPCGVRNRWVRSRGGEQRREELSRTRRVDK